LIAAHFRDSQLPLLGITCRGSPAKAGASRQAQ
jgi:hypothetical protein